MPSDIQPTELFSESQPNPSTPFALRVSKSHWQAMIEHAQADLPLECCGLFAGTITLNDHGQMIGTVIERYPLPNDAASPTEFLSEPRAMLQAMRDMDARGLVILAVYHSHPTSEPTPSRRDRQQSLSESVTAIIVGLERDLPQIGCWWLTPSAHRPAIVGIIRT